MSDKQKTLRKGNYQLEHSIGQGVFGEPKNFFGIIFYKEGGEKVYYPFTPIMKVNNRTKESSIFEVDTYTNEEYEQMLDEQIIKIKEQYAR